MTGALILAGMPIGDTGSASPALLATLSGAGIIAAEDTRRLRDFARRAGITLAARLVSYFEGNEQARTPGLVDDLVAGHDVVLVTDAGMPTVSDPGFLLVRAAIDAGVPVWSTPGPSAVVTALAVSGLPADRFCFEGFLPRQGGPRWARLAELAGERRTMVFYEAPHRLAAFLADVRSFFGDDRPAVVCRELTKTHEETIRGTLAELAARTGAGVRGEITVVVAGAGERAPHDIAALVPLVRTRIAAGEKPAHAVAAVAHAAGVPKRDLYDAAIAGHRTEGVRRAPEDQPGPADGCTQAAGTAPESLSTFRDDATPTPRLMMVCARPDPPTTPHDPLQSLSWTQQV